MNGGPIGCRWHAKEDAVSWRFGVVSVELIKLAPRARILFHLKALFRLALIYSPSLLMLMAVAMIFVDVFYGFVGGLTVWLLISLVCVWFPSLAFERWGYRLEEDQLIITWGVLFRRMVAIPTHRIQHVDTHQGPLDQIFNLAQLRIYTASGMGADGVIPGLEPDECARLRERLVIDRGDDGV